MLRIWYGLGYPEPNIQCPDIIFMEVYEDWMLRTEFSKRVLSTCSGGLKLIADGVLRRPNGQTVAPDKISSGAKVLILLMYTDLVCDFGWCGENCEPFLEEIAQSKDVTVTCTRFYIPKKALVLNNNKEYSSPVDIMRDNKWV